MAGSGAIRAPYSFVPFSNKILKYEGVVPCHDSTDPSLKTGEIHVTMTAETPVFISDGGKCDGGPHFFKRLDGKYALPGSSVRGVVRENMQILGFGLVRAGEREDLENRRMFFREVAAAAGGTGGELKDYYTTALGKNNQEKVKAGYLHRDKGRYTIRPVQGSYLKVSKTVLDKVGLGDKHAEQIDVYYKDDGGGFVREISLSEREDMKKGVLLCPGVDTGGDGIRGKTPKPPSHRYVFPLADEDAPEVPISEEDALSYAADWEDRENVLKGGTVLRGKPFPYDPDFWKLPKGNEEKAVFYIKHEGHTYFGMSLFLRIGYKHSLGEGLPPEHREKGLDFLDYPHAILGCVGKNCSLRSRVSFGDFTVQGEVEELPEVKTVLSSPKPSFYPGYVVEGKHYNKDDFRLRGYKQYWLKEPQEANMETKNEKVRTRLRPLPKGTVFSGVIRYKNLRPEELGLLLWAIRLEDECFQSIGMGKPYGYGQMRCVIDSLREYELPSLYTPDGLCAGPVSADSNAVQAYIDLYDKFATEAMDLKLTSAEKKEKKEKPSLKGRRELKAFFFLRSQQMPSEAVSYMELGEYQNCKEPLPDVLTLMKETEQQEKGKKAVGEEQREPSSMDDLMAALAKKFNGGKL